MSDIGALLIVFKWWLIAPFLLGAAYVVIMAICYVAIELWKKLKTTVTRKTISRK